MLKNTEREERSISVSGKNKIRSFLSYDKIFQSEIKT